MSVLEQCARGFRALIVGSWRRIVNPILEWIGCWFRILLTTPGGTALITAVGTFALGSVITGYLQQRAKDRDFFQATEATCIAERREKLTVWDAKFAKTITASQDLWGIYDRNECKNIDELSSEGKEALQDAETAYNEALSEWNLQSETTDFLLLSYFPRRTQDQTGSSLLQEWDKTRRASIGFFNCVIQSKDNCKRLARCVGKYYEMLQERRKLQAQLARGWSEPCAIEPSKPLFAPDPGGLKPTTGSGESDDVAQPKPLT